MAISLIGGVSVSTFLTLYVVPCVYSLFTRLERPDAEDDVAPGHAHLEHDPHAQVGAAPSHGAMGHPIATPTPEGTHS